MEHYFCSVGPVSGDVAHASGSYRFDLASPGLRAPAGRGERHQGVVTAEELATLRERGFTVDLIGGPFSSEERAAESLDAWWEHDE